MQAPRDGVGTVLLIDDNADLRFLIARMLAEAGWTVLQAPDGALGIAKAQAERPDVVVCDLMLHGADGLAVLNALRDDPVTDAIPVVMLTASDDPDAIAGCMQAGAHDYLVKSGRLEMLPDRCTAALRHSRERQVAEPAPKRS